MELVKVFNFSDKKLGFLEIIEVCLNLGIRFCITWLVLLNHKKLVPKNQFQIKNPSHLNNLRKEFVQNVQEIIVYVWTWERFVQKQPSRGVLRKRYSENMQQIYMKTPMPKCDFRHGCSTANLLHIFRTPFPSTPECLLLFV